MRLRREIRNKLCSRKEPAEREEYNKERNKMLRGAVKGQCIKGRLRAEWHCPDNILLRKWQQAACESVINIKAFYLLDGRGERRKSPAEMKIFIGLGEKVLRREKTRINEKK